MDLKDMNLKDYVLHFLSFGEKRAYSIFRKEWFHTSYRELGALTLSAALEVKKLGLKPEDKIAIILDSGPEYAASFFASGLVGHTTLLLDSKLSSEEMKSIILHSDTKAIITGHTARASTAKLQEVLTEKLPVIFIDEVKPLSDSVDVMKEKVKSMKGLSQEDLAVLVYTSGTTSTPKGVMLTLESIFFNGHGVIKAVTPSKNPVQLSILPQNHMLEFTGGIIIQLYIGAHVVFANTLLPHEIMDRLKAFNYTDMIVVPLFLRSIRSALLREINKSHAKKIYFTVAFALARLLPFKAVRRKIFAPVVSKFGGIQRFVSGGAALEYSTQQFFTLMGFTVCQGYGLTETAPVCTINYTVDRTLGTQGRTLPGTEMKIDPENGEILLRGPHIMKGYYKMPDLTAQAITPEGWFRSGDIGHLDKKGNLFITGRLKELIVLGNGKKVFPDEVESIMQISANIKEIIIVGAQEKTGPLKNTEAVCAVVVPSEELVKKSDELTIRELVEKEIRKHSEKVAAYKRPSKIYLSYQELPKTNTRKNKRMLIKRMIEEGVFA
ncbi:MAG: AMP-binding protein [Bacteriovoracaceae bacterium]